MESELKTSSYDYDLPQHLIASYPAIPANSARLLVYDRKKDKISHAIFGDLMDFLPKDTSILLNDTKVIKARIFGKKQSGGKVEVLLNSPLNESEFKAYIRGKVRVGTIIDLDAKNSLNVKEIFDDGTRKVEFQNKNKILNIKEVYELLESIGHVPLPPYIKRKDEAEDEKNYQSLFAKNQGAVAAPTASLHFTQEMLKKLKQTHKHAFLTLHVGAGTFKPVESEDINFHKMHEEYFHLSEQAKQILESKDNILAVGTTVTRVVEYFARTKKTKGWCKLFLHPKNPPQRTNHLLTNFHLPKSTLLMLVASFVGLDKTLEIYQEAIKREYRFFSYGDAMLIL
ncbi:MAG: tRNA preQ1(34) S-adenosylmethionine ribosyltransferase-isomerase QueA [Proteobacteria bacterium]|nr:MAG: tRNA preQ1(34) S-adenosylmethionine ribosyltransferase-isomerase QueA [Pseudomonadota bacterium]